MDQRYKLQLVKQKNNKIMSKQPTSMTAASLIILRYLKENNTFEKPVTLSSKDLPYSEIDLNYLLDSLERDGLLIKGSTGGYNIDDIRVKGRLSARITLEGERFIDEQNSSFKSNRFTELITAAMSLMNFLK
jgi:hypothetical protein